jgi:pyruvate,water dikinase
MTPSADELRWEAPGPGAWEWQGSHLPGVPTPIYGAVHLHTAPTAMAGLFERYGVPLRTMEEALVNGRLYSSLQPVVGRPGPKAPPRPLLWLATRTHPEMRRRNRTARRAMADKIWRTRTAEWHATLRPSMRGTNLALQAEDLRAHDAAALADHVRRAHAHVVAGHLLHFDLHGDDMGPLGMYLCACRDWGIDAGDAIAALTGHSPSTMAAVDELRKVAVAIEASGADPTRATTIEQVRALGPGVASALDEYLEEYGWRTVTGYDLDAKTVIELPEVLVATVRALPPTDGADLAAVGDAAAAALRARVPASQQAQFDEVLGEARTALDLRDDNGPITVEWPVGLLRRALLEVGRRAVERGVLADADHGVELTLAEVEAILAGAPTVTPDAVAQRAADRAAASAIVPPVLLGVAEAPPDLSAFPRALAAVTDMAMTCVAHLEKTLHVTTTTVPDGAAGSGLGVGAEVVRGVARVARTPEEALAALEPGEVLVVPFTTPAYNAVLGIAGGLITEEGGALSHAAVLARELALPAVIGVPGALSAIADGDEVEVDPVAGTVRLLQPQS